MADTKKKAAGKTAKKTVKKTAEPVEKKAVEEKVPVGEAEQASVDALLAAGEEKKAEPAEVKEEAVKAEEKAPDKVEQVLSEEAGSELAQAAAQDEKALSQAQSEMEKNEYKPLDKPSYEGDNCEEEVEKKRQKFQVGMKKTRRQSTIVMAILVVGLIGGFVAQIYLPSDLKWIVYVIFGVIIAAVVVEMILASRNRKKLYADVDVFVKDAIIDVDSYVFDQPGLSDVSVARAGHIDLSMLIEAHYFDTINAANSRNIVLASYLGKELTVSEVACRVPYEVPMDGKDHSHDDPKKTPKESYGIFGKFITYPLMLKAGEGVIILLEGTNAYKPSYLDGYSEVKIEGLKEAFHVWSLNEEAAKGLLSGEAVDALNSFSSDANMENVFLSVNDMGFKMALNYNETVMEVPMEKPVVGTPYAHYKNDLAVVLKLIAAFEESK